MSRISKSPCLYGRRTPHHSLLSSFDSPELPNLTILPSELRGCVDLETSLLIRMQDSVEIATEHPDSSLCDPIIARRNQFLAVCGMFWGKCNGHLPGLRCGRAELERKIQIVHVLDNTLAKEGLQLRGVLSDVGLVGWLLVVKRVELPKYHPSVLA